jgi:hypothetical protein
VLSSWLFNLKLQTTHLTPSFLIFISLVLVSSCFAKERSSRFLVFDMTLTLCFSDYYFFVSLMGPPDHVHISFHNRTARMMLHDALSINVQCSILILSIISARRELLPDRDRHTG